ncbi:MAG: hypothetical protein A2Z31_04820 [candidate division NC10 bacterium RBG_16_65_8]|nr:MAG: hypothetical protein A2Z31_04820 [candidate division NC10 bacterium RBG_16_65_8]
MTNGALEQYWKQAGGDQRRFVDQAFAGVAADYDWLVRLFSGGLDRRWRERCVSACRARGGWILDCGTGTGAVALAAARPIGPAGRVLAVDTCAAMLVQARAKATGIDGRLSWIRADAGRLPLGSETMAAITLGFALRHMDVKATLAELDRVLLPGGRLAVLEFLRPPGGVVSWAALAYLRWLIPPLAGLLARSRTVWTLAAYLPRTIDIAPSPPELVETIKSAGLHVVRVESLFAQVVWLLTAMKPPRELIREVAP